MGKIGIVLGWIVVVAAMTAITWQIVGAADDRVSDRPSTPLNAAPPTTSVPTSTSEVESSSSTSSSTVPTSSTQPGASSSTSSTQPGSSSSTSSTSPTSSTTPSGSTSSSAPPSTVAWSNRTVSTSGGTVVVSYRPGEVVLQAASPAAGFATGVKSAGPPVVEIEFESDSAEVRVKVQWKDGALDIDIDD